MSLIPKRSTVTGDSKIRSGVRDAEITTSSRAFPSFKVMEIDWLFFETSCERVSNPTLLIWIVKGGFSLVLRVKFPSKSVIAPDEVPVTIMFAPASGIPLSSLTVPLTVVCAKDATQKSKAKALKNVFIN